MCVFLFSANREPPLIPGGAIWLVLRCSQPRNYWLRYSPGGWLETSHVAVVWLWLCCWCGCGFVAGVTVVLLLWLCCWRGCGFVAVTLLLVWLWLCCWCGCGFVAVTLLLVWLWLCCCVLASFWFDLSLFDLVSFLLAHLALACFKSFGLFLFCIYLVSFSFLLALICFLLLLWFSFNVLACFDFIYFAFVSSW